MIAPELVNRRPSGRLIFSHVEIPFKRTRPPVVVPVAWTRTRDRIRAGLSRAALAKAGIEPDDEWNDLDLLVRDNKLECDFGLGVRETYIHRLRLVVEVLEREAALGRRVTSVSFVANRSPIGGVNAARSPAKLFERLLVLCPNARSVELQGLCNDSFGDLVDLVIEHRPNCRSLTCTTSIGHGAETVRIAGFKIQNAHMSPRRLCRLGELEHLALGGVCIRTKHRSLRGPTPSYRLKSLEFSYAGKPLDRASLRWLIGRSSATLERLALEVHGGTHAAPRYGLSKEMLTFLRGKMNMPALKRLELVHCGQRGPWLGGEWTGAQGYFEDLFKLVERPSVEKVQVAFKPEKLGLYDQWARTVESSHNLDLLNKFEVPQTTFRRGEHVAKTAAQERVPPKLDWLSPDLARDWEQRIRPPAKSKAAVKRRLTQPKITALLKGITPRLGDGVPPWSPRKTRSKGGRVPGFA